LASCLRTASIPLLLSPLPQVATHKHTKLELRRGDHALCVNTKLSFASLVL
jgi:hypothetical protein